MIDRVLSNRYKIIEKVGEGGMGYVYKAKCTLLNRIVAIKILQPQYGHDNDFVKSFKREAQATASLCHPNIVNIYDVGKDGEVEYIVMEYVEGKTLKEIINNEGPLKDKEIIRIGMQICEALEHAHRNHIIHRDIKPQNILVTNENKIKVADFGIARGASSTTITQTNKIMGSVHYFSPEQAKGIYIGERSDLYSLGVVLYEMATARVPFEGDSPISVALKHINETPILPSKVNKNISPSLESLILKALSKDQNYRFQNASEMYSSLKKSQIYPEQRLFDKSDTQNETITVAPVKTEDIERDIERNERSNDKMKQNGKIDNEKNNKSKIIITALIALVVLVGGLTWAVSLIKGYLIVPTVNVPEVVGLNEEEAIEEFEKIGLGYEITDRVFNDMPIGTVVEQRPEGGEEVRINRPPVNLWVSKGPKKIEIPNLVGREKREAQIILSTFGLELGDIDEEHNEEFELGTVISHNPRYNEEVEEGTSVDILISKGAEPVEITLPDFREQEYNDVLEQLRELRIEVGDVIFQDNRDFEENTIIRHIPRHNERILQGTSIDLVVSKGYEQGEVRNINIPTIRLPSRPDELQVEIRLTDEDGQRVVYNHLHSPEDSPLSVSFEAVGSAKVEIRVNGVIWAEQVY